MKKYRRLAWIMLMLAMAFPVGCTRSAVTGEKEVILISTASCGILRCDNYHLATKYTGLTTPLAS